MDIKLNFTVWQFVRVMVDLEKRSRRGGEVRHKSLYSRYHDTWKKLDAELDALTASGTDADHAKYSRRMMSDTIVIRTDNPGDVLEVIQALGRVIHQMTSNLRKTSMRANASQQASVRYELEKLEQLRDRFVGLQRKEVRQRRPG